MTEPRIRPKRQKLWWLEQYSCGCTFISKTKKGLMGYCGVHGMDRQVLYPYLATDESELGLAP